MDAKAPNKDIRATPQWALYQRENFWKSNEGEVPVFDTGTSNSHEMLFVSSWRLADACDQKDPGRLEELAKEKLTQGGWYYASSNAGQSYTHTANRQAFYRHRIIPRMLVDTNRRDTKAEIFGHKVSAPIGFAPIGINKIYNPAGELPVAKVAKELNLPYCLSTAGSQPIEAVGEANGEGPRFFQLYMPHDDELTVSLLTRAYKSGFSACILTVDTW